MNKYKIIGKRAVIISENDNYDNYRSKILIITHADDQGQGYDNSMYPELLCSFKIDGEPDTVFPFSLYQYEFKII